MRSSIPEIMDAITPALNALPMLVAAGNPVAHQGGVPDGIGFPRVIVAGARELSETKRGLTQPGYQQTVTIDFWATTFGEAQALFQQAKAALDGVLLPLAVGRMLSGELSYVTDYPDPTIPDSPPHGVIAEYRTRTRAVA